jgi:hypothetical protein
VNGDPIQDWAKGRLPRCEAPDEMTMGFGPVGQVSPSSVSGGAASYPNPGASPRLQHNAAAYGADSLLAQLAQLQLQGGPQCPDASQQVPPEVQAMALQDRDVRTLLRQESSVWQMSRWDTMPGKNSRRSLGFCTACAEGVIGSGSCPSQGCRGCSGPLISNRQLAHLHLQVENRHAAPPRMYCTMYCPPPAGLSAGVWRSM